MSQLSALLSEAQNTTEKTSKSKKLEQNETKNAQNEDAREPKIILKPTLSQSDLL